jgi:hypothetical protein
MATATAKAKNVITGIVARRHGIKHQRGIAKMAEKAAASAIAAASLARQPAGKRRRKRAAYAAEKSSRRNVAWHHGISAGIGA